MKRTKEQWRAILWRLAEAMENDGMPTTAVGDIDAAGCALVEPGIPEDEAPEGADRPITLTI